jgi:hypothetical protein
MLLNNNYSMDSYSARWCAKIRYFCGSGDVQKKEGATMTRVALLEQTNKFTEERLLDRGWQMGLGNP